MVVETNECCSCATPSYPCIGDSCPNRHVKRFYCDNCRDEVETLYIYANMELCEGCLLEEFETITVE